MNPIFLIVSPDIDGDVQWDVAMTLNDARAFQKKQVETSYHDVKIYEIDTTTLASTERK